MQAEWSAESVEERRGFLQIWFVEALDKPAMDRYEQIVGLPAFTLRFPQAGQCDGAPEFPQAGLLRARGPKGGAEAALRGRGTRGVAVQTEPALAPMQEGPEPS